MKLLATTGLVLALSLNAAAAQERLTFASPAPGPARINAFLTDWAADVSQASEGTLAIDVVVGGTLGRHGQMLDRVSMGVVDIAWDFQGYYPGMFDLSAVVEQPFQFATAEDGSRAFQQLFETGALDAEYQGQHVLSLFTFPNASLMLTRPAEDLAGLSGRRITAQNQTMQAAAERLGGVALNLAIPDWYQALSRGTIDGAIVTFTAVPAFRLNEVMSEYIDVQLGGNPGMILMNPSRYATLPATARDALDARSGTGLSQEMGAFLEAWNNDAKGFAAQNGNNLHGLDEDALADWQTRLMPLTETWLAVDPARAAVRETYLELLGHGDD
ncbi:MAG: TRAP transporter substrate-binding protein [Pararhodobacter sp.]|nr:TRAP transporter substrate-binding protein [Pararhodobacter sp.]